MTQNYNMIELYNENTGEYRRINMATTTTENNDQYIYGGWGNSPLAIIPAAPTVIVIDEYGNKIGNVLFDYSIDKNDIKIMIEEEVWKVVSIDGHVLFTPEIQVEHASKEWINLLED